MPHRLYARLKRVKKVWGFYLVNYFALIFGKFIQKGKISNTLTADNILNVKGYGLNDDFFAKTGMAKGGINKFNSRPLIIQPCWIFLGMRGLGPTCNMQVLASREEMAFVPSWHVSANKDHLLCNINRKLFASRNRLFPPRRMFLFLR